MHISWLGTTAVKLQTKPFDNDVVVVIDPYKPAKGEFPRSLTPHIALYTRGEEGSITLSGDPFVLATPGECETKGVLITSIQGSDPDSRIVRVDAEGLAVGHLGLLRQPLTSAQIEALGAVDVLFVPVGGKGCLDAEAAAKVANMIEPRVVIPMAHKSDNDPDQAPVSAFLKEMGLAAEKEEQKIILRKKDLPQDETKIIVLAKE